MTIGGLEESAAASVNRSWIVAGAVTASIVTIARLWISRGRDEFSLWPDEPAQLAMARFLGGGVPWTMHDHSTWQPGYATLLSPVHWLTDDPVVVLHGALALNALLGGSAAWLIVLLVRRLTPLGPGSGAAVATILALGPAALFTTVFVWSESLVAVFFLATVIALLRFGESPTIGRGVLAGAGAALAFGTHSRMLSLAVVTIGVAVVLATRREMRPRAAGIVALATIAAMIGVRSYTGFVVDRLWDEPSTTNSLGGAIDHVIDAPHTTLLALVGQAWYLLVSTVGVVVYGTVELVRAARGPRRGTCTPRRRAPARHRRLLRGPIGAVHGQSVPARPDRVRPLQRRRDRPDPRRRARVPRDDHGNSPRRDIDVRLDCPQRRVCSGATDLAPWRPRVGCGDRADDPRVAAALVVDVVDRRRPHHRSRRSRHRNRRRGSDRRSAGPPNARC